MIRDQKSVTFDLYDDPKMTLEMQDTMPELAIDIPTRRRDFTRGDSNTSIDSLFDNSTMSSTIPTPILSRSESQSTECTDGDSNLEYAFSHLDERLRGLVHMSEKLIIMMVGLPASGKSTLCKQLNNYFNDKTEYLSKIYNAGDVRRKNSVFNNSDFFNPNYEQGRLDRELYADINASNLLKDLRSNRVSIGFLDATNTTIDRRRRMMETIRKSSMKTNVIIMDVQCLDDKLLNFNINGKAHNLDYQDRDYTTSIMDFKMRTEHYYKVYQPITTAELQSYPLQMYIKVVNGGQIFESNLLEKGFGGCKMYDELSSFISGYYHNEGKRYMEAAKLFYKNNPIYASTK